MIEEHIDVANACFEVIDFWGTPDEIKERAINPEEGQGNFQLYCKINAEIRKIRGFEDEGIKHESNALSDKILQKILISRYRSNFTKSYHHVVFKQIVEYFTFGLKEAQEKIRSGNKNGNLLSITQSFWLMTLLDSMNYILVALPLEALNQLKTIKVPFQLGKNNPPEKPVLEVYRTLLNKIPGTKEAELSDYQKVFLYICWIRIKFIRDLCLPQLEFVQPEKKEVKKKDPKKKAMKQCFQQFNKILGLFRNNSYGQTRIKTFLRCSQLDKTFRYIFENFMNKDNFEHLVDSEAMDSILDWWEMSSQIKDESAYQIERIWGKIAFECKEKKVYKEKIQRIHGLYTETSESWIYIREKLEQKMIIQLANKLSVHEKIQKAFYREDSDSNIENFMIDLQMEITKKSFQLSALGDLMGEMEKEDKSYKSVLEKYGQINFAGYSFTPYQLLQKQAPVESSLILKKFHVSKDYFCLKNTLNMWNNMKTKQDQLALFQRLILLLFINQTGSIEDKLNDLSQFANKDSRKKFVVKFYAYKKAYDKVRQRIQLPFELIEIEKLFEQKNFVQGIQLLKNCSKNLELYSYKFPMTWEVKRIISDLEVGKEKLSLSEIYKLKTKFKCVSQYDLLEIALYVWRTPISNKKPLKEYQRKFSSQKWPRGNSLQNCRFIYCTEKVERNITLEKFDISFRDSNISFSKAAQIKNSLEKLKESIALIRLLKIKSIEIDENSQRMEIIIQNRPVKPMTIVGSIKNILEILSEFKSENQEDLGFKKIKFWYFYLNDNNYTINQDKHDLNMVTCEFKPFEALLSRLFTPEEELQTYLKKKKFINFPFIYFIDSMLFDKYMSLNFEDNANIREELNFAFKEIKAIEAENKPCQINLELFLEIPLFWSDYKKITESINFNETFQNQLRYEESRRKNNNTNRIILQEQLENAINDKDQLKAEVLREMLDEFRSNKHLEKDKNKGSIEKEQKERQQILEYRKKIVGENIATLTYQDSKKMNLTASCFYVCEGILEKDAYQMNVFNGTYVENKTYQLGSDYKWMENKPQIEHYVNEMSERQVHKKNLNNKKDKTIEEEENQEKQYEEAVKKKKYEKNFRSLQAHLYHIRCFFAHHQKNSEGKQLKYNEKLKLISDNYPRFFNFIYKWRNIIGKPMHEETPPEHQQSNREYNKLMTEIRGEEKETKRYSQKRFKLPEFFEYEGTVKSEIVKTLNALFSDKDMEKNKKKISKLTTIPKMAKYNNSVLFQEFKGCSEDFLKYSRNFLSLPKEKKVIKCNACMCYALAISKAYSVNNQRIVTNVSLWEFLKDLTQGSFNALFHEHQTTLHCICDEQKDILYYFYNMKKRKTYIRDELISMYQQNVNPITLEHLQKDKEKHLENNEVNKNNKDYKKESTWNKYQKERKQNENLDRQLKKELKETDYICKTLIYQILMNHPNLIQDLRQTRHLWDQEISSAYLGRDI